MVTSVHALDDADQECDSLLVVHFQRRPTARSFSVERLFSTVRSALPPAIRCEVAVSKYHSVGFFRRFYNIVEARTRQGDVNHVTGDVHFLCYLLRKRRTVLTVLDCGTMHRLSGVKRSLFSLLWLSIPVRRCECIVAISEFSKSEILRYVDVPEGKIRVVGVPYDATLQPQPHVFRKDYPTILQVGTGYNKNLLRTVMALKGIPCRLIIVGTLSDAQRQALLENRIDYKNNPRASDAEIGSYYADCDMVAFASTYEGFGMPIIEANVVGRPVVTSNVCSMPEVAGNAACFVDPFDLDSIRRGILSVIEDERLRDRLIQNGFQNATRFAPAAIAGKYAEIYTRLGAKMTIRTED